MTRVDFLSQNRGKITTTSSKFNFCLSSGVYFSFSLKIDEKLKPNEFSSSPSWCHLQHIDDDLTGDGTFTVSGSRWGNYPWHYTNFVCFFNTRERLWWGKHSLSLKGNFSGKLQFTTHCEYFFGSSHRDGSSDFCGNFFVSLLESFSIFLIFLQFFFHKNSRFFDFILSIIFLSCYFF